MGNSEWKHHIKQHLYDVREMIDSHIEQIHTSITENVKQTIKYTQNVQRSHKNATKRPTGGRQMVKLDPSMFALRQLWDQVASPDPSIEPPLQMIRVHARQNEFKPRITVGEEEALRALQTLQTKKVNRIDSNLMLPSKRVVQVDSQIDRFKRQNSITVNSIVSLSFLTKPIHMHLHCYHKCTKVHFSLFVL